MIAYGICFSLSESLHLVWQSLGTSVLLQMALLYSFLWLSDIPLYIYMCVCVCVCVYLPHLYPFICRWPFSCFRVLAAENSTAMNIGVHVSFQIMAFSRYMSKRKISGSCLLFLKGNSIMFSIMVAPIYLPTNSVSPGGRFSFLWLHLRGWFQQVAFHHLQKAHNAHRHRARHGCN